MLTATRYFPNEHMPLGGEWVMYELAHPYWWVNKFICH